MKLYEQADTRKDGFIYSWILGGVSGRLKKTMEAKGWKWIPGRPTGSYVTNDADIAIHFVNRTGVESNGTHTALNAPMFDFTILDVPDENQLIRCPHCQS